MRLWRTPDGMLFARVYDWYTGLRGQERIGFVDPHGRVWHYDSDEIRDLLLERDCQVIPGWNS